jgi:hypothetical protein
MSDEVLKKHSPSIYKEFRQHDTLAETKGRIDTECDCRFWIKRCSLCNCIMESDSKVNKQPNEKYRIQYTDFDKLVCKYKLAEKIKSLKVPQRSRLYWIHNVEHDILSIRTYENVKLRNNNVCSAFTSSEIIRLLSRLPKGMVTSKQWEYIGQNGYDPNRLARLYVRLKQQYEKSKNRI